jgi:serine/threonine protein kinase/Tol biopolymer transport system component
MALTIGTQLGSHQIIALLGKGGMGEVYQAKDSKLGRSVAIKLLPDAFTHDAERTERFQREARVLASLNHPNIAAIHGIEESIGRKFLVMEFVPGETLAKRIKRGPMPIDEAVTIATQLLDGLEAAHEKGVIHRDLKPANIKLTPQGQLKILDFGLAKTMSGANASATARSHEGIEQDVVNTSLSNSPTMMNTVATNPGLILGTAAYMSPEQARGRPLDQRTDIFSFGCVFYEMLTGKPAFDGEDTAQILSRVLQRDPDWTLLPPAVAPGIRQVLRLCLEKDMRKRRRSAGDVRIDIEQASAPLEKASVAESAAPALQRKNRIPWIAAAAFAIAAAAIVWTHFRERPRAAPLVRFEIFPKVGGRQFGLSISPNGRWLAYYDLAPDGHRSLFVRDLNSTESHAVPGTEVVNVGRPAWSPDSRYVGFLGVGGLMKVAPEGGTPQIVVQNSLGFYGSWDGDAVFIRAVLGGIERVSTSETEPRLLQATNPTEGDLEYSAPQFLPDGHHYVFGRASSNPKRDGVFAASLDSAEQPKRLTGGTNPTSARDPVTGTPYLFVTRDGQVTVQPFDVDHLELAGESLTLGRGLYASASDNGVLAISHGDSTSSVLTWYDRRGNALRSRPPEPTPNSVDLSPDGSQLAVGVDGDLWLRDLARGTAARFTADRAANLISIWSPLGDRIVFDSRRDVHTRLYVKPSNAAAADELLLSTGKDIWANDWSRDGRFLLYSEQVAAGAMDLGVLPMDQSKGTRKPIPYLAGRFNKKQGQFSPDGRFVAYASDESGKFEIYVQPFPNAATGKWPISSGGGVEPRWSRNGSELFYLSGTKLMAVDVKTEPNFSAVAPHELFEVPVQSGWSNDGHRWHVAPDGTFLILTFPPETSSYPTTVIVNWPELLKKAAGK